MIIYMIFILVFVISQIFQSLLNVLHLHHLDWAHPSEAATQLRGHARVEGSARSRRGLEL